VVEIPEELKEMRAMLATQGERWITKWTAQGRAEGKADTLLRQLGRKFREVPPSVVARVRTANIDQLDEWSDRILDAKTLDNVFE